MSLLQQLKRRRTDSRMLFYENLINKNKKRQIKEDLVTDDVLTSRVPFIKIIDENKRRQQDQIFKTNIDRQQVLEEDMKEEPEKNEHPLLDNTIESMRIGIHDAKDKNKYVSANADNFKALSNDDQRKIFRIFLELISI